jgi:FtsZ-binding cell division protein ZapB
MTTLGDIKSALTELPISDILKARLEFAVDQSVALERQVEELQAKASDLQAELRVVATDRKQAREELDRLKNEHAEEIRIHHGIEYRKGQRTRFEWMAFCPACHLPCDLSVELVRCSNVQCGWETGLEVSQVDVDIAHDLEN